MIAKRHYLTKEGVNLMKPEKYPDYYTQCTSCVKNMTGHSSGRCAECRTVKCRCGQKFVSQRNVSACSDCMRLSWQARQRKERNLTMYPGDFL